MRSRIGHWRRGPSTAIPWSWTNNVLITHQVYQSTSNTHTTILAVSINNLGHGHTDEQTMCRSSGLSKPLKYFHTIHTMVVSIDDPGHGPTDGKQTMRTGRPAIEHQCSMKSPCHLINIIYKYINISNQCLQIR